jgi:hypothetical protein
MRDHDLLYRQLMLAEQREHILNVVAGVDNHCFARALIANDRAVALQRPDGENLVDHIVIVTSN